MSVYRSPDLVNFGCLNPRIVIDKSGNKITVPCRQCSYCRMHHASAVASLGSLESLTSTSMLFVTLTFANECIPKCSYLIENFDDTVIENDGKKITFNVPHSKIVFFNKNTGEIFDTLLTTTHTVNYVLNTSSYYHKRFPQFFDIDEIPVLERSYISAFIKRLRSRYFRKFKERLIVRTLYCGEYGETTNRPHFHILFYFESLLQRSRVYEIIRTSQRSKKPLWPYGRCNQKYYIGHGVQYLTNYLQGSSAISDVHTKTIFRPFCRHSIRLGEKSLLQKFGDFRTNRPLSYSQYNFTFDGKNSLHHLCPSLENSLYPRCRDFIMLSTSELLKRYTLASQYIKHRPYIKNASQLTDYILKEVAEFQDEGIYMPLYCKIFGYHSIDYNTDNVRNIIYHDCLVSFKFLKYMPITHTPLTYVLTIQKYYDNKEKYFKEKDSDTIDFLIDIHERVAANYFINERQIDLQYYDSPLTDYRTTQPFKDWRRYCNFRLYDASKLKKFKDFYTNADYSIKTLLKSKKFYV